SARMHGSCIKQNPPFAEAKDGPPRGLAGLGGLRLEEIEGLSELLIDLDGWLLDRSGNSGARTALRKGFVVDVGLLVEAGGDGDVGRDAFILQLLAGGRLVLGDGEDEGAAVRQFEGLLLAAFAEGLLADNVAALVVEDGAGDELRRAGGAAVGEDDERRVGIDALGRVRPEDLLRELLAFERTNHLAVEEEVREANGLVHVA